MRLIDADALEAKLEEQRKLYIEMDMKGAEHLLVHDVLHHVWEEPTIDAVPRWIPCEERLPEPNVAVLGYAPSFNNIFAVYYDSVCGWMTWDPVYDEPFPSCQGEIVAWMPLPKPYKGERKDDE